MKALFLTGISIAMAIAGVLLWSRFPVVAVSLWVVAGWLLLKGRPTLASEFGEKDRLQGAPELAIPDMETRERCPCCRSPTWDKKEEDWTCLLCDWSVDAGIPVARARENFKNGLTIYPPERRPDWRPPVEGEEAKVKQELASLYAELVGDSSPNRWSAWYRVRELEGRLRGIHAGFARLVEEDSA